LNSSFYFISEAAPYRTPHALPRNNSNLFCYKFDANKKWKLCKKVLMFFIQKMAEIDEKKRCLANDALIRYHLCESEPVIPKNFHAV